MGGRGCGSRGRSRLFVKGGLSLRAWAYCIFFCKKKLYCKLYCKTIISRAEGGGGGGGGGPKSATGFYGITLQHIEPPFYGEKEQEQHLGRGGGGGAATMKGTEVQTLSVVHTYPYIFIGGM